MSQPSQMSQLLNQAVDLHLKGDLANAERVYQQVIAKESTNFPALANLGGIYLSQGNWPLAEQYLQQALDIEPTNEELLYKMALSMHHQNKLEGAIPFYQRTLAIKPDFPEAHSNLGVAFSELGQNQEAIAHYHQAIQLSPGFVDAYINVGTIYKETGRLEEAIEALQKAIDLNPNRALGYYNLGLTFQQAGDMDQAVDAFQAATQLQDHFPEAYNALGAGLYRQGKLEEAIIAYQTAIRQQPDFPDAYSNLGAAYNDSSEFSAAIEAFNQAIALNPNSAAAYSNLGVMYKLSGNLGASILAFEKALALKPDSAEHYYQLGAAFYENQNIDSAKAMFQQALVVQPDYADARLSLAVALLLEGDYLNGWQGYESRFTAKSDRYDVPTFEPWSGGLQNNHELIILEEQGIGDLIQFMRYGRLLKGIFPVLSIAVREHLVPLVKMSRLFDKIYAMPMSNPETPPAAKWVYLLSVPRLLGVMQHDVLLNEPYLSLEVEKQTYWSEKIRGFAKLVVGLNWQGNPDTEKNDFRGRSFPLSTYDSLAHLPGVQLVSLQKGFGSEQLETCAFRDRFVDCQEEISQTCDWMDTAAIVQACDLIITSDTSIAHLAGALGKPTWILLKKAPDWRWGLEGETSPWYPSMRLFRQTQSWDWTAVMEQIQLELKKLL